MEQTMTQLLNNQPLLLLILAWSLVWKGLALWRASQRGEKSWFVIFLIVNLLGLPEIIYLLVTNGKCCADEKCCCGDKK
ncbi:MAG TPA: DUF5652 family protein [bacterium]|nr:DUF5652 family protein [bacterium]